MITLEIPAPEFVQRFQAGEIPVSAHVTVTYEPTITESVTSDAATTALDTPAVLSSAIWDEDAPLAGEELDAERRLFEQFEDGINVNRRAAGMRSL